MDLDTPAALDAVFPTRNAAATPNIGDETARRAAAGVV